MRLPEVLKQFVLQSAIWTALCFATEAICRFALHLGYPYNYPAVPPSAIFGDFRYWRMRFLFFHSRQFFDLHDPMVYPAPVVVVYKFFLLKPISLLHPQFVILRFIGVILLSSWVMLAIFRKALIRRGLTSRSATIFVLVTYLFSFPFWLEIHQANMEFAVWIAVILGIWAFWSSKYWTAAACFGVAAAMKIFPFVFVGLFLARKQYRQAAYAVVVAAATTVLSLWLVCPDIGYSWRQTSAGLADFRKVYMLHLLPIESGFDHSLFALFKRLLPSLPPPAQVGHMLNIYLLLAAVGGCVLFFVKIRKLPLVNQIFCLSIAGILLPPTSYDYTLLHLYAPFVLLTFVALERAAQSTSGASTRGLFIAFALLAFLLSSQSEFIYRGIRFAGQIKAIALFALWIVALLCPFEIEAEKPSRSSPALC